MEHLDFGLQSGRCYGRREEASRLLDAYRRVRVSSSKDGEGELTSELVLVYGYSGTGKTALVQTLRDPVLDDGGYFISGKFDQLRRSEPYSAFVAAFTEFCDLVVAGGNDKIQEMKAAIMDAVGTEGKILTDVIPALERIIGEQHDTTVVKDVEAQANRFHFILRNFARVISRHDRPVVLFLDDLQWADASSLDLIINLAGDISNASLLFVLTFRDNEVSPGHSAHKCIQELERKNLRMTRIEVTNLSRYTVNEMLSDIFSSSPEMTAPLAHFVYQKTHGNPFFIVQYLRSLCDDGLIHFNDSNSQWVWDLERIQSTKISDDVVELMAEKIKKLPKMSQEALKIAACLGADVSAPLIELLLSSSCEPEKESRNEREFQEDVKKILVRAVYEGFMIVFPLYGHYRFAHDRIQQAAYSLVAENEREAFHLRLGRILWRKSSEQELNERLFIIVDQLNRGEKLIEERDEKGALARLNLKAGEKAMLSSAFAPAATYLNAGTALLDKDHWKEEYNLCYSLYNAAAEAEYCNANFETLEQHLQEIFLNAKSFHDKVPAFSIRVNALGAQDRLQEALDTGFDVLRHLGERFPSRAFRAHIIVGRMKTKWMVRRKSNASLLRLPLMDNPEKIAAMQLLNLMVLYTYLGKAEVAPLVFLRLISVTLRYGLCAVSSYGFATYGAFLCGVSRDMEEGYRFGQAALSLLEKFQAKEWLARVYALVYGCIDQWNRHITLSLESLKYAHRAGLETGDIEFALMNAHIYCLNSLHGARPLSHVEADLRACCHQMADYKQEANLILTLPYWQAVLNFIGPADDPLLLTGEAMSQDEVLNDAREKKNETAVACVYYIRLILAYFFGEYDIAEEMAEKSQNFYKVAFARFDISVHCFYNGLTALSLAQKSKRRNWRSIALNSLKKMTIWAKYAPCNFNHKVSLLKAEFAAMKGKHSESIKLYVQAIEHASEQGFIHEQALICERAGIHQLNSGDLAGASKFLKQARSFYSQWGAHAKVDQLNSKFFAVL